MSKITICKGNIIMTSKGDTTFHTFDGSIVSTAGGSNYWGGEQGTIVGDYQPMITSNKLIISDFMIRIRPHSKWEGEFGFDWFRTGDTKRKSDIAFYDILGRYISDYNKEPVKNDSYTFNFLKDIEQKQDEKGKTKEIIHFGMFNNLIKSFAQYKISWKTNYSYTVPMLTLLKGKTAKFSFVVETNKNKNNTEVLKEFEKGLSFEFEKIVELEKFYRFKTNSLTDPNKTILTAKYSTKKKDKTIDSNTYLYDDCLTIECKEEFNTPYKLIIKNKDGKICGAMIILPNAPEFKRKIKIALINVKTKIYNEREISARKKEYNYKKNFLINALNQSLIEPEFEKMPELDCSDDFIEKNCDIDGGGVPRIRGDKKGGLFTYFQKKMEEDINKSFIKFKENETWKYENDCYTIFLIDIIYHPMMKDELLGESYENISMCYGGANRTTIAHELMHSLGLNHTFSNFPPHSDTNNNENLLDFSYRKNKTDNIMDYEDKVFVNGKLLQIDDFEKISTYHWQWVVINPNLVKLDSKTPITTNNLFKEISKL